MSRRSIPAVFHEQADALRSRPMVFSKQTGHWRPLTWAQMRERVAHAAAGLCALEVQPGARVALLAPSAVEWVLCDLACACAAAVSVPIPETSTPATVAHILADAGCEVAFVGSPALLERVLAVRPKGLRVVVYAYETDDKPQADGVICLSLLELERRGMADAWSDAVERRVQDLGPDDLLTLIYTSGTTGEPKGVMLTHGNVIANCEGCARALPVRSDDVLLSFLPLSHAFERTTGYYMALLFGGATVYYASSVKRLFREIGEVRPTIMTGVPRIYERIYARFEQAHKRASRSRRLLMQAGLALGQRVARARQRRTDLSLPMKLGYRIARDQIFDPLTERLGGRVRFFVSGGAPLRAEVGEFFLAAGVLILEGYGLTEAGPVISVNRPESVRFGTVGEILHNVRVRLADDGEILVRGPNVMPGYWNRPEETAEVLVDGWLHTGDVGRLDRRGRLCITDRKKDLFKSSGGKYIAPQRLEALLSGLSLVEQACVVGDGRAFCAALIVPDVERLGEALGKPGRSLAALVEVPEAQALIAEQIGRLDDVLERHEQVRSFRLVGEAFTEEEGLLTATLKVRRNRVVHRYAGLVDEIYAEGPRRRRP